MGQMFGWEQSAFPEVGVMMLFGNMCFFLAAVGFGGLEDVVIKSIDTFRHKVVAGVSMSSEGDFVLILDINDLLSDVRGH